jgi:hypothetical protein
MRDGYCPGCGKLLFVHGQKWNDHLPNCPVVEDLNDKIKKEVREYLDAAKKYGAPEAE